MVDFRCRVSGVSKQMTDDRKQKSDRMLHLPFISSVFDSAGLIGPEHFGRELKFERLTADGLVAVCRLISDLGKLTPDTRNLK